MVEILRTQVRSTRRSTRPTSVSSMLAWRFKTDTRGPRPIQAGRHQLMVNGVLYATPGLGGGRGAPPGTGELKWFTARRSRAVAPPLPDGFPAAVSRTDRCQRQLILSSQSSFPTGCLECQDWRWFRLCKARPIDLKEADYGLGDPIDPSTVNSASMRLPVSPVNVVIVGRDVLRAGAEHHHDAEQQEGLVQAATTPLRQALVDLRTIRCRANSARQLGGKFLVVQRNNGVLDASSATKKLGMAYLPIEAPTGDYYGGHGRGTPLCGKALSRSI